MLVLYNFGIKFYVAAVYLASMFNAKAKKWLVGQKNIFNKIEEAVLKNDKHIWFHASSLGEFEQGRPVIEEIKQKYPQYKIVLTFFSPSGYEVRKNYQKADYVFYLPIDTKKNAQKFLQIIKPELAFFVKYEFWYHYLNQLSKQKIPAYIFSAIFNKNQLFFKPYGKWYRRMLTFFDTIYVQNKESEQLLSKFGIKNVFVAGDTRIDRVLQISKQEALFPIIDEFCENSRVIVAGSTWGKDEELISKFIKSNTSVKWIIAPHEVNEQHIQNLKQTLPTKSICYTEADVDNMKDAKVLIINIIGILSAVYRYGLAAYIGGGFGAGIHNTLEPLSHKIPVVFGPKYQKFQEAKDIIKINAGFSINNYEQFELIFNYLISDRNIVEKAKESANIYLQSMSGGTNKILSKLAIKS